MVLSELNTYGTNEMREQLRGVKAVGLDIFGTATRRYTDIHRAIQELSGGKVDGWDFAKAWMNLYGRYMDLATKQTSRWDYDTFMREALREVLQQRNLDLSDSGISELNYQVWHNATLWSDVRPGMETMQEKGLIVSPFSNGGISTLNDIAKHNGLRWDFTVSPENTGGFKSAKRFWEQAPTIIGYERQQILFVSTTASELDKAAKYGFPTVMVPRQEYPGQNVEIPPGVLVVPDFNALVEKLRGKS